LQDLTVEELEAALLDSKGPFMLMFRTGESPPNH
jgi:hypothetical protein